MPRLVFTAGCGKVIPPAGGLVGLPAYIPSGIGVAELLTATVAATTGLPGGFTAIAFAGVATGSLKAAICKAAANSPLVEYLSEGFFAIALVIIKLHEGGKSARASSIRGAGCKICIIIIWAGVSDLKGICPVSIS